MNAQRRVALLLSLTLAAVPLAACGGSNGAAEPDPEPAATEQPAEEQGGTEQTGIANPFVDCETAYDAAQLAGFDVNFPESVQGYSERTYQAVEGQMAQCFYSDGEQRVLVRKAVDDGSGDISGDYGEYASKTTVTVGDVEVTEKGDGDLVYVAIWAKGGYLFAIDADAGLSATEIETLVHATM